LSTSETVTSLIAEGWAVVPIRRAEKRPYHVKWIESVFGPADFAEGDNIGVKCGAPSSHRVDIDLDCAEAVRLAPLLLPPTRTHGHGKKPRSHWWYTCPDLPGERFDCQKETVCEIRSTGHQTVVPPSLHPEAGEIVWDGAATISTQSVSDLRPRVALLAGLSYLTQHWPGAGVRHESAGPLGGWLARCGLPADVVKTVVQTMATVASDPDPEDRARYAYESALKHERGETTTGLPSLEKSFGKDVVAVVAGWINKDRDDLLTQMNDVHFVTQIGSTVVVGTETPQGVWFQPTAEFSKWYMNRQVGKQRQGEWWLTHRQRRQYAKVVFAPPPRVVPEGTYNLWTGFAAEPSSDPSGRGCAMYIEHIHQVICGENRDHTDWVLDFLADIVQRPGQLIGKTLAVRGRQGTGKSAFVESFGRLFGRHFIALSQREQITGKFNAHLSGKVVVFADEALWGGAKQDVGAFKRLVTQTDLAVERKGIDISNEPNCAHLFIASNEKWIVPAGDWERRVVILDVPTLKDREYFKLLWNEILSPDFGPALLAFLQARRVNEDRIRRGLVTAALVEQQGYSADAVQQWWEQILHDGSVGEREESWPPFLSAHELYQQYTFDMANRGAGATHRGTRLHFANRLRELMPPCRWETRRVPTTLPSSRVALRPAHGALLPPLAACRAWFDSVTGTPHEWPESQGDLPLDSDLDTTDSNL
jgi:hypothetical protein